MIRALAGRPVGLMPGAPGEHIMSVFNIVRMRVKPEAVDRYITFHRDRKLSELPGMVNFNLVKTGERDFCVIGEWRDMDAMVAARPTMIGYLDTFRDGLEDLGGALGVTDPVSGEAVVSHHA
jgi:quinol monooxygenase YgiN